MSVTAPTTPTAPILAPAPARAACSSDEWSPLREVIVGRPDHARIPNLDRSAWLNLYGDRTAAQLAHIEVGLLDPRLLEETDEDLAALVTVLQTEGVTVHRPDPIDQDRPFTGLDWGCDGGFSVYCPRDLTLVVDSLLIEAPSPMRARTYETTALRRVLTRYAEAGSPWIAAPRPRLADDLFPLGPDGRPRLGETEPVFEAANLVRAGRDLLYLVSGSANEAGLRWLQTVLSAYGDGDYTVHPVRGVYPYTHLDSTIALLRPGLALLNPARITEETLPGPLRGWDRIWCPPMAVTGPVGPNPPLSSEWIGMNLLMVRPDLAVVDATQTGLIRALERHRIGVLPVRLRHARELGGGLHCVTLDTVRDGGDPAHYLT